MKRLNKKQIAARNRRKHPEQTRKASQIMDAFRDNYDDDIATAPQRDHKAPALRPQPQQASPARPPPAPAAPPPPLPATEVVELTPLEAKEDITSDVEVLPPTEEQEEIELGADEFLLEAKDDGNATEDKLSLRSSLSAREENGELKPLYSSDDEKLKYPHESSVAVPGLIATEHPIATVLPPPQQPQLLAASEPMHVKETLEMSIPPSRKPTAQIIGSKRRNSPQNGKSGGNDTKASKPPLKMMRADEYVTKVREPSKSLVHSSPAKQHSKLGIPGTSIINAGGFDDLDSLVEKGVPLASPSKKPSCLADAVTAAQMVAHLMGEGVMKPNQYSLRPLPPPQPLPAPPPPSQPLAADEPSEDLPSLSVEIEHISLHGSGGKNDRATGITQMGDSEPQEEHRAAAKQVAEAETEGVRFAKDLLSNRVSGLAVMNQSRVPPVPAPVLPVFAAGAAPAPAIAAPALVAGAAANNAALRQSPMLTPEDAIPNPPPAYAAAPSTAAAAAPPPSVTAPRPAAHPAPTPLSTTRPGSNRGPTTSPAPVELNRYLHGTLLDAMIKHGGVPRHIYQWQAECLNVEGGQVIDADRNLVYTAPTSAGKTLVAEILLLRALAKYPGRKTMLVLPYRALCHEKAQRLSPLLKPLDKNVVEYHGGHYSSDTGEHTTGIIVATIENANSILNRHLEEGSTPIQDEFSCIVCDELHLLSDPGRGYLLELLLTKLRYQAKLAELKVKDVAEAREAKAAATGEPASVEKEQQQQQQPGNRELAATTATTVTKPTETTTTPLRTISTTTGTSIGATTRRIQIIGMSATLPNIKQIGNWLDAAVYVSDHRPVPLTQYLKRGREMLTMPKAAPAVEVAGETAAVVPAGSDASAPLVSVRQLPPATKEDPDHVAHLTRETVDEGHSVLIFCGFKKACLWEAKRLAKLVSFPVREKPNAGGNNNAAAEAAVEEATRPSIVAESDDEEDEEDNEDYSAVFEYTRESVAEALEALPMGQSKEHAALVRKGIAYHNSDLTKVEKLLIEGAYRSGAISVLCATSTLAAGVNLPARRVIFLHAYKAMELPENYLTVMQYHQMAGRAGRAGIDEFGESILIQSTGTKVPKAHFEHLIKSDLERIESCLTSNSAMMQHAMLEVISSGSATTPEQLHLYVNSFLATSDGDPITIKKVIGAGRDALIELGKHQGPVSSDEDRKLLIWEEEKEIFTATIFGKAVTYSGLAPDIAVKVMVDLAKARTSFVMDSELYSCFVCVPVHTDFRMAPENWNHLQHIIKGIQNRKRPGKKRQREEESQEVEDPADWKAANNIGVFEDSCTGYLLQKAQDKSRYPKSSTNPKHIQIEHTLRKFYIACLLQQLASERVKEDVAVEFYIRSPAFIDTLQENTARFAKKCREFCRTVHWFQLAAVLDEFGSRIRHGAKRDILALSKIKGVKPPVARLLFQSGLRNVEDVAAADQKKIMKALAKGNGYANLSKEQVQPILREKAAKILAAANDILRGHKVLGKSGEEDLLHTASPDGGRNRVVPVKAAAAAGRQEEKAQPEEQPEEALNEGRSEEWEAMEAINCPAPAPAPPAAPAVPSKPAHLLPAAATGALAASGGAGDGAGGGAGGVSLNASDGNKNEQGVKEPALPPPVPSPGNPGDVGGGGGNTSSQPPQKPFPTGLFLINAPDRLERLIRILSKLSIFGAHFVTVPHKRALVSPFAQISETAAMAPPLKIKKKEGQRDKKKSTTTVNAGGGGGAMYDADLDAGDPIAQKNAGPKPGTVIGIAISWAPGAAAYIPFYGNSIQGSTWETAAQKIADVIVASDVEIVWFGWKNQVEATRWLLSHASKKTTSSSAADGDDCSEGAGTTSARARNFSDDEAGKKVPTRTGADLHRCMTDARIAMWMCQPDSCTVQDGILTDDDLNSSLLSSDGKRKHSDEKRIFGAEVLLHSLVRSLSGNPETYVANVLHGLHKDDRKRPMGNQALHACQTAAVALQLRNVAMKFLTSQKDPALFDALRRYEMPLVPVLADMERAGAGFSIEKLNRILPRMKRRLAELHTLAHKAAGPGPEFSMTSPTDIRDVIYRRLQLPPPHGAEREGISKKDGSKYTTYSTGKQFLLMLKDAHPIVPMIIEHRRLTHTVGRVRDMIELAKAERALLQQCEKGDGGKYKTEKTHGVAVHCPFIHTGTATGRLAMEGFNLQNLTKPYAFKALPSQPKGGAGGADGANDAGASKTRVSVKNKNSTEHTEGSDDGLNLTQEGGHMQLEANLRSAIVPSKPHRVILGADFRQIEFRLMAHFSKDPVVKEMLQDGAEDPFKLVAARWKKVPVDKVTSKVRDDAKQIVYALFYGMGAGAMADKLVISPKRAQQMKDEFLNTYSGIKCWIEQVKIDCTEIGYIKTLAGRRRWISSIKSEDWQMRASGERKAVNSICQGSAADVAKKAMIDICREFEIQNLRDHVDMVLQIHDEFVFEVDVEYQKQVAKIVKECMENAAVLEIPLRAKLEVGSSWGELTECL